MTFENLASNHLKQIFSAVVSFKRINRARLLKATSLDKIFLLEINASKKHLPLQIEPTLYSKKFMMEKK